MNGVANITDKILEEARAWAQEHTAEGEAEAAQVRDGYEKAAKEQSDALLAEAEAGARQIDERAKSQADMDRRKALLGAKQTVVGSAFDEALASLASLPDEERALLMVRMAVKYQSKDAELIFNQKDQAVVGPLVVDTVNALYTREQFREVFSGSLLDQLKKLVFDAPQKKKAVLSKQVGSFAGGFVLKEGDIENNCTFEVLVSAVRDELEGEVSSLLFQ